MAAGLGFKNFASGDVLTAADVNAYLNSQTVMVFADAAARTAAITSPQEGMFSYLKDTNATQYYTGSAWTNLDTTGMVNPMTTTGDTIYSSSGTTPARLGIGSTGQVLTVSGGLPTWATSSSGGMTLLSTTTLSGATTTISSINQSYTNLFVFISGVTNATANGLFRIAPNGSTNIVTGANAQNLTIAGSFQNDYWMLTDQSNNPTRTNASNSYALTINNYASTTTVKPISNCGGYSSDSYGPTTAGGLGYINTTSAITSLVISNAGGNLSTGTVLIYGVK